MSSTRLGPTARSGQPGPDVLVGYAPAVALHINVPAVMAAVLLSVLPLVVLFIVMRKQVIRSLGSVVMR